MSSTSRFITEIVVVYDFFFLFYSKFFFRKIFFRYGSGLSTFYGFFFFFGHFVVRNEFDERKVIEKNPVVDIPTILLPTSSHHCYYGASTAQRVNPIDFRVIDACLG